MLFVVLLVVVKDSYDKTQFEIPGMANTINDDEVFSPEDHHAFQPMTFGDALTAIQARKLCKTVVSNKTVISASTGSNTTIKKSHFEITGLHDRSKNWQIPYLKCDSRKCMAERQDATSFCEVSVLALTGADEGGMQRARDFSAWLYQRYPILSNISVVQVVEGGDAALEARVRDPNYGRKSNTIDNNAVVEPKISMGVVFRGNDPNKYAYRLRQNATNFNTPEEDGAQPGSITTPRTTLWQSAFSRTDFEVCDRRERSPYLGTLGRSCTGQYLYNGVLAAQRLVQDFVLADTGATAAGYGVSEAGVQFVQFPQPPYRLEGFFDTNGACACWHSLFGPFIFFARDWIWTHCFFCVACSCYYVIVVSQSPVQSYWR